MTKSHTPPAPARARQTWMTPTVVRIDANTAENGLNNIRSDGPISTGS